MATTDLLYAIIRNYASMAVASNGRGTVWVCRQPWLSRDSFSDALKHDAAFATFRSVCRRLRPASTSRGLADAGNSAKNSPGSQTRSPLPSPARGLLISWRMKSSHLISTVVLGLACLAGCSGESSSLADSKGISADSGVSPGSVPGVDARGIYCDSASGLIPAGQSNSDNCNTCTCDLTGRLTCTANFCPLPTAADSCSLPVGLGFDPSYGNASVDYHFTLVPPAGFGGTRWESSPNPSAPAAISNCSPTLPACGMPGVVSISTIVQDLTDPEVQAALSVPTREMYGVGALWSIGGYGRMGSITVGSPCPSPVTNSCKPIPVGLQRLADDLKSLAALCPWP